MPETMHVCEQPAQGTGRFLRTSTPSGRPSAASKPLWTRGYKLRLDTALPSPDLVAAGSSIAHCGVRVIVLIVA